MASGLIVALLVACGSKESGIAPPSDQIFLPTSVKASETGRYLYVVNSNLDLRFNGGTVTAIDLNKVKDSRTLGPGAQGVWPLCPATHKVLGGEGDEYCCWNSSDTRILNCDESPYVLADQSVRIGSFAGSIASQSFVRDGNHVERLFVAVRSEPSVTFIDAILPDDGSAARLDCGPEASESGKPPLCDDAHKILKGPRLAGTEPALVNKDGEVSFRQEPFALTVDPSVGLLYVGHLLGTTSSRTLTGSGITVIDICNPEQRQPPTMVSFNVEVFGTKEAPPGFPLGVTGILPAYPGGFEGSIFATAKNSADIGELVFSQTGRVACDPGERQVRPIALVAKTTREATGFYPRGADLRGLIFDRENSKAFALHHNTTRSGGSAGSVAAISELDISPDQWGTPRYQTTRVLEVCAGATKMVRHDAGDGPRFFVTCFDRAQVYVVDPQRMAVDAIVEVGQGPTWLDFPNWDSGTMYVAHFADNNVGIVDLASGSATRYQMVQTIGFPKESADNANR